MSCNLTVVGLDLSLTSTGMAKFEPTQGVVTKIVTSSPPKKEKGDKTPESLASQVVRYHKLAEAIITFAEDADLVIIEGPSLNSRFGKQWDRAGLWWQVVHVLTRCGCQVVSVPPTARAKYCTGRGNAHKDLVLAKAVQQYPDIDITGNDIADAVVLMAMGLRHEGFPIDDLPASHLTVLDNINWKGTHGEDQAKL